MLLGLGSNNVAVLGCALPPRDRRTSPRVNSMQYLSATSSPCVIPASADGQETAYGQDSARIRAESWPIGLHTTDRGLTSEPVCRLTSDSSPPDTVR